MVGLLLAGRLRAVPRLAAADDVVDLLEGVDLDSKHIRGAKVVPLAHLEEAFDDRLGVALGVVALDRAFLEAVEGLLHPVDLDALAHHLLPPQGSLHQVHRARHAAGRKQSHVHALHPRLGGGKPLPG